MTRGHTEKTVRYATYEDVPVLAEMIARAFAGLPASRYLVPDEAEREKVLAATFRLDLERARQSGNGIVTTFAGLEGAAVSMYHSGLPEPAPVLDEDLEEAAGGAAPRFLEFYTALDARRRQAMGGRPHWHLELLAVDPDHQRRGLGRTLLLDRFAHCGVPGTPIYLEAATEKLVATYRGFGFRSAGDPIVLGDGQTRMFPMWREADTSYL